MLIKRLYFIATALLTFSICSCGESYPDHPWEWDQETEEEESNPDIVSQGWTAVNNFGNLPDYIHIYKSPENLAAKKAIAYIAVADMSKLNLKFWATSLSHRKPMDMEVNRYIPLRSFMNLPRHR